MANCRCGEAKNTNGSVCIECEIPQMERIRYFTGRMMAARDFTAEQLYHVGKARRHNQWMHGSGVACGLKVKQHDNPECQDHFVIIEPGLAIDCCGRELLLNSETVFDFRDKYRRWLQDQKGPDCPMDSDPHVLQIAARYSEYPTEEVPLLFEACATGDTASAPSRVREIIEMDVMVDPEPVTNNMKEVALKWKHTLTVERPIRVAIDEKQSKVYVLAGGQHSKLYVFRMENESLIDARSLHGRGIDLALSTDGSHAYVALEAKDNEGIFVEVLDTTHLSEHHAVVARIPVGGNPRHNAVRLAVSPTDGALFVLNQRERQVMVYDNTINHHGVDFRDALRGSAPVGHRPTDLVVTPDGKHVVVANRDSHDLTVINPEHLHQCATVEMPDASPYGLAAAYVDGRLRLIVSDRGGQALWMLVSVPSDEQPFVIEGQPLSLKPYQPVDMLVSPNGRWLYLLIEGNEDRGRLQVADLYAWVKQGKGMGEPEAALAIELEIEEEEEEREEEEEEEEEEGERRHHPHHHHHEAHEEAEEHEHHRLPHMEHEDADDDEDEEEEEEEEEEHGKKYYYDRDPSSYTVQQSAPKAPEEHPYVETPKGTAEPKGSAPKEPAASKEPPTPVQQAPKDQAPMTRTPKEPAAPKAAAPKGQAPKAAAQETPAPIEKAAETRLAEQEALPVLGMPVPVGREPRDLALAGREGRLYISYEGTYEMEGVGGVAIIDAVEEDCLDLFNHALEQCPTCTNGSDWVVLATIPDYRYDQPVTNKRIDNLRDRRWLASVETLTEVVTCLVANGTGGRGEPGRDGPQGMPGEKGERGEPGEGLNRHLTHICSTNWEHGGRYDPGQFSKNGLLVAFDRPIRMGDVHRHSFIVSKEVQQPAAAGSKQAMSLWLELVPQEVHGIPLYLDEDNCEIDSIDPRRCENPNDLVNGAVFKFSEALPIGEYRVTIKGDFIRDEHGRPVDANHLAPWLPERHTGDWVSGGTFESWFTIIETGKGYPKRK